MTNKPLEQLEETLRQLLVGHRVLLTCAKDKREAVRLADLAGLETAGQRELVVTQRLAELEQQRGPLAAKIAESVGVPEAAGSITALAEHLDEPHQGRLLVLAAELRDVVTESRRETSIVRAAVEALSQHVNGIMETVRSTFGGAVVYGREGRLAGGAQLDGCVDLRS
jgi:hypothetical protein